jgi:medium-chain acyl-[acyl-carrier-protein] hydrolase
VTSLVSGKPPFEFPITSFYGVRDRRISSDMVRQWERFTARKFECLPCEGHHLWPLEKEAKAQWLTQIVERVSGLIL